MSEVYLRMDFLVEMRGFLKNHYLEFNDIWQKDSSGSKWVDDYKKD